MYGQGEHAGLAQAPSVERHVHGIAGSGTHSFWRHTRRTHFPEHFRKIQVSKQAGNCTFQAGCSTSTPPNAHGSPHTLAHAPESTLPSTQSPTPATPAHLCQQRMHQLWLVMLQLGARPQHVRHLLGVQLMHPLTYTSHQHVHKVAVLIPACGGLGGAGGSRGCERSLRICSQQLGNGSTGKASRPAPCA